MPTTEALPPSIMAEAVGRLRHPGQAPPLPRPELMASRTTGTGALPRRMFIALWPTAEIHAWLSDLLDPLATRWPQLRWSPAANWHLTLAFLARVTPDERSRLIDNLAELAARTARFDLGLCSAGAFPAPGHGKALWLGADEPTGTLDRLASDARKAARRAGLHADDASFTPHLTIARSTQPVDLRLQISRLMDAQSPRWQVDELVLVDSLLGQGPAGAPRYVVQERFALARH